METGAEGLHSQQTVMTTMITRETETFYTLNTAKGKEVGGTGFQRVVAMTAGFAIFLPSLLFRKFLKFPAKFEALCRQITSIFQSHLKLFLAKFE